MSSAVRCPRFYSSHMLRWAVILTSFCHFARRRVQQLQGRSHGWAGASCQCIAGGTAAARTGTMLLPAGGARRGAAGRRPARPRPGVRGRAPRAHAPAPMAPAGQGARHTHGGGFRGAGAGGARTVGPHAAPAAITRLWAPTDGAQRDGAIGRAVRRRNAATHAQPHLGCRPRRGKTPTAQQRGRRP